MKYIILSLTLIAGACVTKSNPARTDVYVPGVGTTTYHCPPGQRKKGNC